jgi:uncharacterized protein Smg (DUF494 family)
MNRAEIEVFKDKIKSQVKKNGVFAKEEIEQIMLVLEALIAARHKYAVSAQAERYNFDFGIRAANKYQDYTAAITFFERLVTCLPASKR